MPDGGTESRVRPGSEHGQALRHESVEVIVERLDAQHLHAILPLTVRPAHESVPAPLVGRHLATLEPGQHLDELVDVVLTGEIQARTP